MVSDINGMVLRMRRFIVQENNSRQSAMERMIINKWERHGT